MSIELPQGYRVAGVHCGLKRNPQKQDLGLVLSSSGATAAGVYTQNRVRAAPVRYDAQRTPSEHIRAVVTNSGNANACTGEQGDRDTMRMAQLTAAALGAEPDQVLVLSTGIIGEMLPMDRIESGIRAAATQLANDEASLVAAARAMLTTDTVHKLATRSLEMDGRAVRITGMAKGAAMIGPNMATMLAVILTDAALQAADAQALLSRIVSDTFNMISVDGHMSTNDTVLLLANGAAGGAPLAGDGLERFGQAAHDVCEDLARAIPGDGEGAAHLITIDVRGCARKQDARDIAHTVANSPLVKTAVAGADPNWGRIVSAVGYAGVRVDPQGIRLWVNSTLLFERGSPVSFDAAAVSRSIAEHRDTQIEIELAAGDAQARVWTCDLTEEYVRLNAEYHT